MTPTERTTTARKSPRSTEYRASSAALAVETPPAPEGMPALTGYAMRWGEWTEINSKHEGRFLERFARGAFKKTIRENAGRIRALLDHGYDPSVGDKPLGPLNLQEDATGLRYTVELIDTSYNRDLIEAVAANLYGASIRFGVTPSGEEWRDRPGTSAHNPKGLPERTIREARLVEVSVTPFPAYAGTSATLRTEALRERISSGKPWTAPRRRARMRAEGILPPEPMTASQRKAALRAAGLTPPEPMSAAKRKRKLRRLRLVR